MPSYRGVDQADLVRSITDALELLETHSTGPELQSHIDQVRKGDPRIGSIAPLAKIVHAQDDAGLAAAVRGSGLTWLFSRAGDLLTFHAVNDTDGKGKKILEDLVKWNATGAAMTAEYNAFDEESDVWLAVNYARNTPVTQETLEKLDMLTDAISQNRVAVTHAFVAAKDLIEMAHNGASDADLGKIFLALDGHERHIVKTSLTALFTLDGAQADMVFQPAIRRYGVVIDDLTSGKINWTEKQVSDVRDIVEKALGPFYELDEVEMTGIGLIGNNFKKGDPQGVIFQSSARAAQAVADALPGMKVLDMEGNTVPPRAKPHAPKPAFKP